MDLLLPGLGLIVWNSLFFLIAFAILAKFAWKPILSMLDARDKKINDSLAQARQAREELAGVQTESQEILKQARREREEILGGAKQERERLIEAARTEAGAQASAIMQDANVMIEREKQRAKEDLKKDIAGISIALAEKVLGEELKDVSKQQKTLEDSIAEVDLKK